MKQRTILASKWNYARCLLLSTCFSLVSFSSAQADTFLFGRESTAQLIINNRVLARVNGKAISVIDVMKKMDMFFLKQFPEYTSVPQARFQYYQINWKPVLDDLIDKELILADAEEMKVKVSAGDVRQEMENMFGPNIIENLDKIGLSFEEAYKIVHGDILLRRMMFMRVNNKAMRALTPQEIKAAYEEFAEKNQRKDTWNYRVVTVRNHNSESASNTANLAHRLLTEDGVPLNNLKQIIKESGMDSKSSLSITDELFHTEADLGELLKPILANLESNTFSKPFSQKSRDNSTVFRIIFLKEKINGGAIPFSDMETQLHDQLLDEALEIETNAYLKKLRQHYDIKENFIKDLIPEYFQPFELK